MEMAEEGENLAILIFNWEYNGRENLPGVKRDKEALDAEVAEAMRELR